MRDKRTSNNQTIRQVIEDMMNAYRLNDKLGEAQVIGQWDKVVGKMIARETSRLYIKNRVLFVKLSSPALRNELDYARSKLIKSLNKAAGSEVIVDIVFS